MRVLFITRKWPPAIGGMETYSVDLSNALSKYCNLEILSLKGKENGQPPSLIQLAWFAVGSFAYLVKNHSKFDAIHFGDLVLFPLAWATRLLSRHVRIVITVYGLDLLYGNQSGLKPAIYRAFTRWAARRRCVDRFISISRNTSKICHDMGFRPTATIPLGVRPSPFLEPMPVEEPFVLFVGRLVPRKGARWFAENVLDLLPDSIQLFAVGNPWDREETEALEANPRVRVLGFLPEEELVNLKRQCIAMVMPNIKMPGDIDVEGFGIVAVEASSQGIPLVAANLEGLADAVRDGETGFLVESGNPEAWAQKIIDLQAWSIEKRQQFGKNAREMTLNYYSWDRVARETSETYTENLDSE